MPRGSKAIWDRIAAHFIECIRFSKPYESLILPGLIIQRMNVATAYERGVRKGSQETHLIIECWKLMRGQTNIRVSAGISGSDLNGNDNRILQAAIDYVASFGGGTVEIGPGRYTMYDSLHLRSHVNVIGSGEETVLVKAPAAISNLVLDGDYGEEQVTLESPESFKVGHGITVTDDRSGGFHTIVGTILWQDEDVFGVSKPMAGDYLVANNARAASTFPVVSGYHIEGVSIKGLTIEGSKDANPYLTGCRGAGIFLYRGHGTRILNCRVLDYSGDGISFQQSHNVTLEACTCRGNTHLGLHPGSGSESPIIRYCTSEDNGQIGLFLCWRVKFGKFENNKLLDNGVTGISIGHKDTDNTFRNNRCCGNGTQGVLFRNESEPMAAHRNYFEQNDILDNGNDKEGYGVRVLGETKELAFASNRIGNESTRRQQYGFYVGEKAGPLVLANNELLNHIESDVHYENEALNPAI